MTKEFTELTVVCTEQNASKATGAFQELKKQKGGTTEFDSYGNLSFAGISGTLEISQEKKIVETKT